MVNWVTVMSSTEDVRPDLYPTIVFATRYNDLHEIRAPFDYTRLRERLNGLRDA